VVLDVLPHLYLFELLDLCLLPGITADQRCAAERQTISDWRIRRWATG
jgi:hypothetical protein